MSPFVYHNVFTDPPNRPCLRHWVHPRVSRSPAFAYGILRWALDMSVQDALAGLNSSGAEYGPDYLGYAPKHRTYIDAVETALSG